MDFLMKLTQLKNKELAAEMAVDRSLISLLRTGKRKIPQNRLHIRHMAESFAKRITTEYQRQALCEVSGLPGARTEVSAEILTLQIERWLLGDIDLVDQILDGIEQDVSDAEDVSLSQITAPEGETFFYYGDEGKRKAFRVFISNIKDGMIGIFDNTNLDWICSDSVFAAEVQALIKERLNHGSTLTQIIPPISNIKSYTDSLRFLLPIYTGGNVNVYYYPRLKDSPGNMTLVVAPGQCVSFSYGYGSYSERMITIVSTNKEFINAHAEQFREYLSHCRSALIVHREPPEFLKLILDFFALNGDVCQKTLPLSTMSMSCLNQRILGSVPLLFSGFRGELLNSSLSPNASRNSAYSFLSRPPGISPEAIVPNIAPIIPPGIKLHTSFLSISPARRCIMTETAATGRKNSRFIPCA